MNHAVHLTAGWGRALLDRARVGARIVHLGALVLALGLSPDAYRKPWRGLLAVQVSLAAGPLLLWFTLLATLISVVIIRIVVVTALSYGLSQYALEMVVRVLVLELIPMTAALAVAMQVTLPAAAELARWRHEGRLAEMRRQGIDVLRTVIAPRALAGMFSVLLLAATSGVIALVVAYLMVHGFSPWAFERFTRLVGHVFTPAVSMVFVLKTLGLAAAVSLLPLGSALHDRRPGANVELQGLLRMFVIILLIELLSLMGNYL